MSLYQMLRRSNSLLVSSVVVASLVLITACSTLGSDDEDADLPNANDGVIMATFTATAPGSTPELLLTREAAQTAVAITATAETENPQPTPTANPEGPANPDEPTTSADDALSPPQAHLIAGENRIAGTLGAFHWQWDDEPLTYAEVDDVPFIEISSVALTIPAGQQATVEFSGKALQEQPVDVQLTGYRYEDANAIPTTISGEVGDRPVFIPQPDAEPVLEVGLDPSSPDFTVDLPSGQYLFHARANWEDPLDQGRPIFVDYVFNVIVS